MTVHASQQLLVHVQDGEESLIRLVGELDITTADQFRRAIEDLLNRHACDIVLDVSDLQFCDVAGLRAMVWGSTLATGQDHTMRIVGVDWLVREMLALTGAEKLVNLDGPQGT